MNNMYQHLSTALQCKCIFKQTKTFLASIFCRKDCFPQKFSFRNCKCKLCHLFINFSDDRKVLYSKVLNYSLFFFRYFLIPCLKSTPRKYSYKMYLLFVVIKCSLKSSDTYSLCLEKGSNQVFVQRGIDRQYIYSVAIS